MDRITTTIKRQWLAEIIAGTKKVEYRDITPYWRGRLSNITLPFQLRLINGMQQHAPEVTVKITRVSENTQEGRYELHIGKIIGFKNWDAKRNKPDIDWSSRL